MKKKRRTCSADMTAAAVFFEDEGRGVSKAKGKLKVKRPRRESFRSCFFKAALFSLSTLLSLCYSRLSFSLHFA